MRSARHDAARLFETLQGSIGWARAAEPTGCGASLSPSMTRFGIAARFNATSSAVSEAAAALSCAVHAVPGTEPVVSAEWLHANLRDPDVKPSHFVTAMDALADTERSVVLLGYQIWSPQAHQAFWDAVPSVFPVIEKVSLEHLDPEYAFEESDVFVLHRRSWQ
ncbi:protein N-lysine methyltransferase METTL21A [Hordeum vulgare]|nr:protein N-lysine methyltransferase METTL21A [Hordeum vulgare]